MKDLLKYLKEGSQFGLSLGLAFFPELASMAIPDIPEHTFVGQHGTQILAIINTIWQFYGLKFVII